MLAVDETIREDALHDATLPILRTTGLKPITFEDGRAGFAHPTENGNYIVIEAAKGIDASPFEQVWLASRTDAEGRGFRLDRPQSLHKAIVSSLKLKDPTYSRGLDSGFEIADAVVSDENECGPILAELLTRDAPPPFRP